MLDRVSFFNPHQWGQEAAPHIELEVGSDAKSDFIFLSRTMSVLTFEQADTRFVIFFRHSQCVHGRGIYVTGNILSDEKSGYRRKTFELSIIFR